LEAKGTAVALEPENFGLRILLAQAEREVGSKSAALDHINQILAADPENPAAKLLQARWV
jgi:thioredoxin-like negative regulator of GroEL